MGESRVGGIIKHIVLGKLTDTFISLSEVMVSRGFAYVSIYQPVYFKYMQLSVC